MSPQLRLSAAFSTTIMAIFALAMSMGGAELGNAPAVSLDAPVVSAATLGE